MKCKSLNQKGFTLIELLAVITILAIIMLFAATGVTTALTSSQKKAFVIDSQKIIETAKLAYMDALLDGTKKTGNSYCFNIKTDLIDKGYLEKTGNSITGSVKVDGSGDTVKYTLWYSNGKYSVNGITSDKLDTSNMPDLGNDSNANSKCGAA